MISFFLIAISIVTVILMKIVSIMIKTLCGTKLQWTLHVLIDMGREGNGLLHCDDFRFLFLLSYVVVLIYSRSSSNNSASRGSFSSSVGKSSSSSIVLVLVGF